jgi:hypothetical protein
MLGGIAAKADPPGFMGQIFSLVSNPAASASSLSNVVSNLGVAAPGGAASPLADLGSRFFRASSVPTRLR